MLKYILGGVQAWKFAREHLYPIDISNPDLRTNKHSGTISTLASIYDSKGQFVKELQVLLDRRLLEIQDRDSDNEVRSSLLASASCFLTFVDLSRGDVAEEHPDPCSSVRRGIAAGVRGHVEGYDRFEEARQAYPGTQ